MARSLRRLAFRVGPALALAAAAAGCGHPATDAECREILDRIVDLELKAQHVTDPAEVVKRRKGLEESISSGTSGAYDGCRGKRITDKQMQCVRGASSVDQITDVCLK
jgi:hypothetical protein